MAETYLEIREQLETAIEALASCERELGTAEEVVEPIKALAEGLNSPFCLVVLGEKGCGKSSLLNAFIREDLSPLDEVSEDRIKVFRHGTKEVDRLVAEDLEECARPLDVLHRFTLIDTPANLLLGDARLLTRDIFPIADLVLCVFSVGNPWAPSTWEFLRNVKKEWLSKVVFVVQQADLQGLEEAKKVAESLASHAQQCLGVAPVLFEISAKQALLDDDARKSSGIEELELFVQERTAESHGHIQKARVACLAARGPMIDIAERVRGTLYLASLEKTKIDELSEILSECKERSRQEVRELLKLVADAYLTSQEAGEELLKKKLTLLETLKSAFVRNAWELTFQETSENEIHSQITRTTDAIKADLLSSSQRFLESSIFSREEDQQAIGVALGNHGKQLSDQIRKTLARNRSEGLEEIMRDILDASGLAIRKPTFCSIGCLLILVFGYWAFPPLYFGLAAAVAAVAHLGSLRIPPPDRPKAGAGPQHHRPEDQRGHRHVLR